MSEFINLIEERLKKYVALPNESKIQSVANELVEQYPNTPVVLAAMAVMYVQNYQKELFIQDISRITDYFVSIID